MYFFVCVYVCVLYVGYIFMSEKFCFVSKGDRVFGYSSSNILNDEII